MRWTPDDDATVNQWRSKGSHWLGAALATTMQGGDGNVETISLSCTAWLPPGESGAVDAEGQPVALYKIQYLNGPAAGYSEEVQENELQGLLVRDVDMAPAPVAAPRWWLRAAAVGSARPLRASRRNGRRGRSWGMICRRSTSSFWGGWPIIWRADKISRRSREEEPRGKSKHERTRIQ